MAEVSIVVLCDQLVSQSSDWMEAGIVVHSCGSYESLIFYRIIAIVTTYVI
jgi:hypothetical protein